MVIGESTISYPSADQTLISCDQARAKLIEVIRHLATRQGKLSLPAAAI